MIFSDITSSLKLKKFYRFTGPPENWLTAIKFMTWGLEEKHRNKWENIQPGDIFFIHSTGKSSSLFKNAKSGIIGLGVVGSEFTVKDDFLWTEEFKIKINKWPLLIPLSEIYLFSDLPNLDTWQSPNITNTEETKSLIDKLLSDYIPLSEVKGFPPMGSFSSVSDEVAQKILYSNRPLYVFEGDQKISTPGLDRINFTPIKNATDVFRYAETLKLFDFINKKIVDTKKKTYFKDTELLAKAEIIHATILQQLIDYFKNKGYTTLSNRHVDLYAHNENNSVLIEVKSIENKNFRSQARKGVIQLLEYDYFEVAKYIKDNNCKFSNRFNILVPSSVPKDTNYISFINKLDIGLAVIDNGKMSSVGNDYLKF